MDRDFEDIKSELNASPFKLTPQRQEVLQVIFEHRHRHLSAEDIYEILRVRSAEIGLATVYRALDLFIDINILHKVDFGDGRTRYEITPHQRHRHHHLICLNCGEVTEAKEDLLNQLEEVIERENDFLVVDHSVKFYGYCKKCHTSKSG